MYLCNIDKCYYPGPRAGGASIVGSHTVANIKGILIDLSAAAARGGYCPPLWSVRADVSILSVITQLLMTTVEGGRGRRGSNVQLSADSHWGLLCGAPVPKPPFKIMVWMQNFKESKFETWVCYSPFSCFNLFSIIWISQFFENNNNRLVGGHRRSHAESGAVFHFYVGGEQLSCVTLSRWPNIVDIAPVTGGGACHTLSHSHCLCHKSHLGSLQWWWCR